MLLLSSCQATTLKRPCLPLPPISARVNNYGSRIDLIITAGLSVGAPPAAPGAGAGVWVSAAAVWQQYPGSDHCPTWADFRVAGGGAFPCSSTGALHGLLGGCRIGGWVEMVRGSRHVQHCS